MLNWWPGLVVTGLVLGVHMLLRKTLGLPRCMGDEHMYAKCGGSPDPYAPVLFLRVPMMAWLSRQAHRFTSDPELTLRWASVFAAYLTVIISMFSAYILAGTMAALLVGVVLALMPGRAILSFHLWPDIWLALWLSLSCLVLIYPQITMELRCGLLGVIAMQAFLTRFDAVLLAPASCLALAPLTLFQWSIVLLPTVVMFIALSARNGRKYGIVLPDNTWMFNLMVTSGETAFQSIGNVELNQQVVLVAQDWRKLSDDHRWKRTLSAVGLLLRRPGRSLVGLASRLWASLGPDSFVLHRLLPPTGKAYPRAFGPLLPFLRLSLILAFPILVASILLVMLVSGAGMPVYIWPILALAAGSLLHNRTRYRQAWLPGTALLLCPAFTTPDFMSKLLTPGALWAWLLTLGLAAALAIFHIRHDTGGG